MAGKVTLDINKMKHLPPVYGGNFGQIYSK